ncbi:MAG: Uncharacterised protein [Opitutia bacterium UBA7350]|nr:MAG: Uncharacterised protein [Opitutae bacterium UBA7350]
MHLSFDLYPSYLQSFDIAPLECVASRQHYAIHAMRNYAYRTENGRQEGPFPQVRPEGSLELECLKPPTINSLRSMEVTHTRSWSTWTGQKHSSKQTIAAKIDYAANATGSPGKWKLSYQSDPIFPVKSYRYSKIGPMRQTGHRLGNVITISTTDSGQDRTYQAHHPTTSLYTLIERLQAGVVEPGPIDYLDDLTMFRPGLEITPLPDQRIEIKGTIEDLHGFALVGPALLPLYFWQNSNNHVLAVIGRNVAYTLTEIECK